jgi:uncharacterized surface protein with fasciclin (FAS1) repeats
LFKALNVTAAEVLADKALLNAVLSYHVVARTVKSSALLCSATAAPVVLPTLLANQTVTFFRVLRKSSGR